MLLYSNFSTDVGIMALKSIAKHLTTDKVASGSVEVILKDYSDHDYLFPFSYLESFAFCVYFGKLIS